MTFNRNVQLSNTPFTPELQNQAVLSGSSAVEDSKVLAAQPDQNQRTQDPFQSQTIDGRYKERLGGGQCASNQSQLVMNKHSLGLPRTKALCHAKSALDDFRKKRCLPEAIEQLVVQGLTSDAAVALVTHVVGDFGLRSISAQSEVFYELTRLEKAVEAGGFCRSCCSWGGEAAGQAEHFKAAYPGSRHFEQSIANREIPCL